MQVVHLLVGLGVAAPALIGFRVRLGRAFSRPRAEGTDLVVLRRSLAREGFRAWARATLAVSALAGGFGLLSLGPMGALVAAAAVAGASVFLGLPVVTLGGVATYVAAAGQKRIDDAVVIRGQLRDPGAGHLSALSEGAPEGRVSPSGD